MDAEFYPVDRGIPGQEDQPVGFIAALFTGARRAAIHWPVLLIMLLGTLVPAGVMALIPALNLFNLAHNPVIAEMAAGVRASQLVDLAGILSSAQSETGMNSINGSLAMIFLGVFLLPLAGGPVTAFLYGGVLLTYKEARLKFEIERFLWGCWHWFGGYLLLGLVQAGLFFGLYLTLISLILFLARQGPGGIAAAVAVVSLLLFFWLVIFELARVRLLLNDTRNPFRALSLAFYDLSHRPLPLLGFYIAALLFLLGVQAFFRLVINPRVPLDMLLLALVVQQGFILSRLFCRALRLAGLVSLLQEGSGKTESF